MRPALKAKLFRGFADPSRLTVLERLCDGPRCVGELVKVTGLSQPNLSMHLACLRDCGLVRGQRNGRFVHYELADPAVARLLHTADRVLNRVARQVAACPRYEVTGNRDGQKPKKRQHARL